MLHIGHRIKEVFDRMPKGHTADWLAARLHCKRANVYNIFGRQSVDTILLARISRILDHDFFADLSADLHESEPGVNSDL